MSEMTLVRPSMPRSKYTVTITTPTSELLVETLHHDAYFALHISGHCGTARSPTCPNTQTCSPRCPSVYLQIWPNWQVCGHSSYHTLNNAQENHWHTLTSGVLTKNKLANRVCASTRGNSISVTKPISFEVVAASNRCNNVLKSKMLDELLLIKHNHIPDPHRICITEALWAQLA